MQLGMIGLGRMGTNIVRRLMNAGHQCVVTDLDRAAADQLVGEGSIAALKPAELAAALEQPRAV